MTLVQLNLSECQGKMECFPEMPFTSLLKVISMEVAQRFCLFWARTQELTKTQPQNICLQAGTRYYPSLHCFLDKNRSAERLSRQVFQPSSNNAVPPVPHVTSKYKPMELLNTTHCSFMTACQSKQGGYLTHTLMRAELHFRISQVQT